MSNITLTKASITLELQESNSEYFATLKNEVRRIVEGIALEFTNAPHITLDLLWVVEIQTAVDKLFSLKDSLNHSILADVRTIRIWSFQTFISNRNWKKIFYLEVEWGKEFFALLRLHGYSIQTPHMTIFDTHNDLSPEQSQAIVDNLNASSKLKEILQWFLLNLEKLFLRNKRGWHELEIIETLQMGVAWCPVSDYC